MHRILMSLLVASLPATADCAERFDTLRLDSGAKQVVLLELYTSEGCSSCPPADRWLSTLKSDKRLWRDYAPIALHVDYWNYIGWDDRFARVEFGDRQRNYVRSGAARASYTPGFFSHGEEWLGWRYGAPIDGGQNLVGDLSLQIKNQSVTALFVPVADFGSELNVSIAVLGMQIETNVRAGENKGRTLTHDFVALDLQTVSMHMSGNGFEANTMLNQIDSKIKDLAIVAWVSAVGDQTPLQAVGGYLARSLVR